MKVTDSQAYSLLMKVSAAPPVSKFLIVSDFHGWDLVESARFSSV
jgi:hypothetical protein